MTTLAAETTFVKTLKSGDRDSPESLEVKRVQEWLTFHGFATGIDGEFGPATEACVNGFQKKVGLSVDGQVDEATLNALINPMRQACAYMLPQARTLSEILAAVAQRHLWQNPREVGADNCGPWVRLYMDGHEGKEWPWCAGFATYILSQAAGVLCVPSPIARSYSCDVLATEAHEVGRLLKWDDPNPVVPIPGWFFLVRDPAHTGLYRHIGIVRTVAESTITTIEGNGNTDGSSNGYEVCSITRSNKYDWIRI